MCLKCTHAQSCVTSDDVDAPSMIVTRSVYHTLVDSLLVIYDFVLNHRVEEPVEDEYDDEEEFNKRRDMYEEWKVALEGMNNAMALMRRAKVEDDDENEDEDHVEETTEDAYYDEPESNDHERRTYREFIAVLEAMHKIREVLRRAMVEGDDDDDVEDEDEDEDEDIVSEV